MLERPRLQGALPLHRCDPTIDSAITRAHSLHTTDPGVESQQWARIDRTLTAQVPWVPYANGVVLKSSRS
jgi:hypothetical protein